MKYAPLREAQSLLHSSNLEMNNTERHSVVYYEIVISLKFDAPPPKCVSI